MRELQSAPLTKFLAALALLVPLSLGTRPAAAQDAGDPAGIAARLEGIRVELQSIAQLLGAVEQQQRVSMLMTRIQLKQRRLSSLEGQLRSTRDEQEGAEQEIERLTAIEENWAGKGDAGLTGEGLTDEERRGLEMVRAERKNLASRVETLRLRAVELENDLARAQEEILTLEETVDEQLGLR